MFYRTGSKNVVARVRLDLRAMHDFYGDDGRTWAGFETKEFDTFGKSVVELLCPHVICVRDDADGKSRADLYFEAITEYDNEFVVIDEWEDGVLMGREARQGELMNRLGITFTLSMEEYERFCTPVRD